jgi:hypothetical protein
MPQKVWAVGEEVLAADFNTYAQNQVVPQFTNTAQRDAQWVSPPNGALCVTVDTGSVWQRIGGVWYKPYSLLGTASITSQTGAVLAETSIGTNVTVTIPAGRRIRLTVNTRGLVMNATNNAGFLRIKEGASIFTECQYAAAGSQTSSGGTFGVSIAPSGGTHTYGVYLAASAGTAAVQAAPSYPTTLDVWDEGAA